MEIKKVAVIGAGTMGSGIAYLCAWKGFEVKVCEVNEGLLKKGLARIREYIVSGVSRGKMSPKDAETVMNKVKGTTDLAEAAKDVDLVIEAVFEDINIKKTLFTQLDTRCPPHAILASNTSALSITEMASATKRPEKIIGLHFFNPAYTMKLVEVVMGEKTSEETRQTAERFLKTLEKETVVVKDSAGFIVNRIVLPMLNEAACLVYEGKTTVENVDKAITLGMNFPAGPFRLADFVGLDVALAVLKRLNEAFGDKFKPCPLLIEKVNAGHLGLKTRKGFYEY
ncbi:MAG: 3-hydroxyacyl-CoA dehydrogenase family protein [Candidatus Bathyarchaeia archaeon]|nr:3-hydroxyacyl-CoA dehydrogenase family protein [Candidatus Bathyarchaeota archaeon A05DMB-4]MDH7595587.1 3-hydroxyacyl-CoA dehydrogenase family protein [Candidatus Bathyarchaeota archaeon]